MKETKKINPKTIVCFVKDKIVWCIRHITYKMVLIVLCMLLVQIGFSVFQNNVNYKINKNTKSNLTTIQNEALERIRLKLGEEVAILKTIAVSVNGKNEDTIEEQMIEQIELHGFSGIHIVKKDGTVCNTYGNSFTGITEDEITSIESKGYSISKVMLDQGNQKEYLNIGVPMNVDYVLVCGYDLREFTSIIENSHFETIGTTIIAQEDGTLIARPDSLMNQVNLFQLLDSIDKYNEKTILKLKNSIQNKESGIITYGTGEHKRYICYQVVPETNWYTVSFISSDTIEPLAKSVSRHAHVLWMEMMAIFAVYVSIVLGVKIYHYQLKRGNK